MLWLDNSNSVKPHVLLATTRTETNMHFPKQSVTAAVLLCMAEKVQARSSLRVASPGAAFWASAAPCLPWDGWICPRGALKWGQVAMKVSQRTDVVNRSRAQPLTPIPFCVTPQLGTKEGYLIKQGKIVKVRKSLNCCFCSVITQLRMTWSWNCSTCISLQTGTICVLSNNKAQL